MEAYTLFLIFGAVLLLAAAGLWFSRDPRKSLLLVKVPGREKMPLDKAKQLARKIASAVACIGLVLVLVCAVMLLRG